MERFPPINMGLFLILFFTVRSVAVNQTISYEARNLHDYWWWIALGAFATISFFFRLRVFDEIKDYDIDMFNHPQRVLQSGRINLSLLKIISLTLILIEIIWSVLSGLPAFVCWMVALGYSLLMRYEFFIPQKLNSNLLIYGSSHMIIMPLIILWIYVAHSGFQFTTELWLLCAASLLAGFSFELARKIHAPEFERDGVNSYSKTMGYAGSIIFLLIMMLGGVLVQAGLLYLLDASCISMAIIAVILIMAAILYFKNLQTPSEKLLRKGEKLVSLFMIASYITIIIEVYLK